MSIHRGKPACHSVSYIPNVKRFWFTPLAVLMLSACGGSSSPPPASGGTPPPPPPAAEPLKLDTGAQASSYLAKTTFGPTDADVTSVTGKNASDLLQEEFAKPAR